MRYEKWIGMQRVNNYYCPPKDQEKIKTTERQQGRARRANIYVSIIRSNNIMVSILNLTLRLYHSVPFLTR